MDLRTLRSILKYVLTLLTFFALARQLTAQPPTTTPGITIGGGRTIPKARPDSGPKPKTIRGTVNDSGGNPVENAHVLVKDSKTSVTRTLTTNADGIYSGTGFPSGSNYEIVAEFQGQTSDKKTVSAYLDREDNVLNFRLNIVVIVPGVNRSSRAGAAAPEGPQLETFDLVKLQASLDLPSGVAAPFPAVLLLHGFGEDRSVWNDFKKSLLAKGLAVMTLDLRGHGDSKIKNNQPIVASREWRTSPHEFPLDLDAAVTWLKTQTRINSNRIAIIGVDVGANLALIGSGRFQQVKTVVAVNPILREGQEMAGSAQDFNPHSALIFSTSEAEGNGVKTAVQPPVQLHTIAQSGGTAAWFQNKEIADSVLQWLKDTL